MINLIQHLLIIPAFLSLLSGCTQGVDRNHSKMLVFTTQPAPAWDQIFIRSHGWFGGDGIFAIPTVDRKTQLIIFSDTMVGEMVDSTLQEDYQMVNNSVAFLEGKNPATNKISFPIPTDSLGHVTSVFPVSIPGHLPQEYYWLGDGFLNHDNNSIYIFAYRVVDHPEWTDALFKFELLGSVLIKIPDGSTFPFRDQVQIPLPFFNRNPDNHITFGAGVFENTKDDQASNPDGYLYIYGIRDPGKQLIAARVQPEQVEAFDQWEFYQYGSWVSDFTASTPIAAGVSNELSVNLMPNGQYGLIFQIMGIEPTVGIKLSDSPVGPFDSTRHLWDCSSALAEPEFFAYNAKAHPSLSNSGELLISYNVNSFSFWDQIEAHPHLYRPRFFKLIFKSSQEHE